MRLRKVKGHRHYETADGTYCAYSMIFNSARCWFLETPLGHAWDRRCSYEPRTFDTLREVKEVVSNPLAFPGPRANARRQAPAVCIAYAVRAERIRR